MPGASPTVHRRGPDAFGLSRDKPQQTPGPDRCSSPLFGWGRLEQVNGRGGANAVGPLTAVPGGSGATSPGATLPRLQGKQAPHPFLSGPPKRPGSLEGGILVPEPNGYPFPLPPHKQPVSSLPHLGPGDPHGRGTLRIGG